LLACRCFCRDQKGARCRGYIDSGELAVAHTGEQPRQSVGAGMHAPASMWTPEFATDVLDSALNTSVCRRVAYVFATQIRC